MKQILISICIAFFIVEGCTSIKTTSLSKYSTNISFYENTADYYSGDKIMKCKLSDTAIINGYKCISWIWFFEDEKIKQFVTAEDIKMPNYVIPKHSTIFFDKETPEKIKYIWFAKDVKINNIACKGGGKISTEFYNNDSLKACFLTEDQNIQGFSCKSSLFEPVYFHPTGKIKILTLSADNKLDNTYYKKGESIIIDENGSIARFKR